MRRFGILALLLAVGYCIGTLHSEPSTNKEPLIGHMVYFQLKDNSEAKVKELVAACDKYLNDHPGTVFYGTGLLAKELIRPDVSDREWDVGLHLVFKTKADHDKYQVHQRHKQFIEENKANWKKVRVFDALVVK